MSGSIECRVCGAANDAWMCRACCAELERAIAEMPSLMHEVSVVATKQTRVYRANGQPDDLSAETQQWADEQAEIPAWLRSREGRIALPATALMVNLDARELLWAAGNTLSTWTRHLAESSGSELPSAAGMVAWLLHNVQAVRFSEAGAEMHDEVTYLRSRMTHAVDRSPSRIYAGPCQTEGCTQPAASGDGFVQTDLYALWRPAGGQENRHDDDDREFACDECETPYTWRSRRPWLADAVRDALVTVEHVLDALPELFPELTAPPRATINGWIKDSRLMSHGYDWRTGEPLFVGAEVLNRIASYKPRAYAPRPNRRAGSGVVGNCA